MVMTPTAEQMFKLYIILKEPEGEILTLWATYETDMKRVDGDWKIYRHRLVSRGIRQQ